MIWTKKPVSKEISELNTSVETLHNSLSKMGLSPTRYNYNNSLDAVKSTLQTFVNGLANNSVGVCILAMTATFSPFAGGDWFVQINKTDNTYFCGVITSYAVLPMVYVQHDAVNGWTFKPFANKSDIDAINSHLAYGDSIANCNSQTVRMARTNSDTLNTPYKQGLTQATEGLCIQAGEPSAAYKQQVYMEVGGTKLFIRQQARVGGVGTWGAWDSLALNSNLKNHRILTKCNRKIGALSAGAHGYTTVSITIPSGYKTTGIISTSLGHPSAAGGLSIVAGINPGVSGTRDVYVSYYAPITIAESASDIEFAVECISDAYYTDPIV